MLLFIATIFHIPWCGGEQPVTPREALMRASATSAGSIHLDCFIELIMLMKVLVMFIVRCFLC